MLYTVDIEQGSTVWESLRKTVLETWIVMLFLSPAGRGVGVRVSASHTVFPDSRNTVYDGDFRTFCHLCTPSAGCSSVVPNNALGEFCAKSRH